MTYKLSKIAEGMDITNSNRFRNEIIEEYKEVLESLDSIDKSIINKNIEMLPVYKINEGFFNRKKKNKKDDAIQQAEISNDEVKIISNLIKKELNPIIKKYNSKTREIREEINKAIKQYDDQEMVEYVFGKYYKGGVPKLDYHEMYFDSSISVQIINSSDDPEDAITSALYKISKKIVEDFKPSNKIKDLFSISVNHNGIIDINLNINNCRDYLDKKINESFAVDLDSLKYVIESEQCTLEEAIQKIKDVNYIGDTYEISCLLPDGFNEQMTLDQFITLHDTLTEAGINLVWTKEVAENEFVNENLDYYSNYIINGDIKHLNYKNKYSINTPTDNIPSFVDIKDIENKSLKYSKSINLKNVNKNRDYPFKFFRVLSISQDELNNLVYTSTKDVPILKRFNSKVYQYNFIKESKRISLLIITSDNKVKKVYVMLYDNKLVELKI